MALKNPDTLEKRLKRDKRILNIFIILLIAALIFSFVSAFLSDSSRFLKFINSLFNTISLIFLITGFISTYYYWKRGLTRFRKIIIYVIISALVLSSGVFTYLKFIHGTITTRLLSLMIDNELIILLTLHFSLSLGLIISSFFIIIMGFGAVGVMSAVLRRHSSKIFDDLKNVSRYTEEDTKKENYSQYLRHKVLGWFFSIPYVLNTSKLIIEQPKIDKKFSRKKFKTAILWELFFGIIISINISLNPFLLEYLSLSELFSLTSGIAIFIPIVILPWFVYDELKAEIKGPYKNFSLYEGLKNRIFEILVTVGTLYTFLRLAIKDVNLYSLLTNFITYLTGITLLILFFTYVYFNYFERDLVLDIYHRYKKGK